MVSCLPVNYVLTGYHNSKIFCYLENVTTELSRLEDNAEDAMRSVNQSFDALQALINKRKQEVLSSIETIQSQKRKAFSEQLQLIETEKGRVERDCEGIYYIYNVYNSSTI